MTSWRPEGWQTPNYYSDNGRAFEAGADAMLGAFKATGSSLDVDERQWRQGWEIHTLNGVPLSKPLAIRGRGTLVWIPDEEGK